MTHLHSSLTERRTSTRQLQLPPALTQWFGPFPRQEGGRIILRVGSLQDSRTNKS